MADAEPRHILPDKTALLLNNPRVVKCRTERSKVIVPPSELTVKVVEMIAVGPSFAWDITNRRFEMGKRM